jgi:hypothetical protein
LKIANCLALTKRNITLNVWFRAVRPRRLKTAISAVHTKLLESRFSDASPGNPKYEILYLGENPDVVARETRMMYSGLAGEGSGIVANPGAGAFTVIPVSVYLGSISVADLTHPEQADIIETNAQELTGDWRAYKHRRSTYGSVSTTHTGPAPTQQLGQALFDADFKAFVTFSAVNPRYKTLAVFTERLVAPDRLLYDYEDDSGQAQNISIP